MCLNTFELRFEPADLQSVRGKQFEPVEIYLSDGSNAASLYWDDPNLTSVGQVVINWEPTLDVEIRQIIKSRCSQITGVPLDQIVDAPWSG